MSIISALFILQLYLKVSSSGAVAQSACAHGWSYNVTNSRCFIYANSGKGHFNITIRNVHSVRTQSFRTFQPSPVLLNYLYDSLNAVLYTGKSSFIYNIPLRTHRNGTVVFHETRGPTIFKLPDSYGLRIKAGASDTIGQRIFYGSSHFPKAKISDIITYTPGSNRIVLIYRFQLTIYDLAYDPMHRRLYILADYLFQLDIGYQNGLKVPNEKGTLIPKKLECNMIFGIKRLSLEYDCLTDYPHLHFVSQPQSGRNIFYWQTINGTSGRCYQQRVRYRPLGHKGVRQIGFLSKWVYIYHPDNSITIYYQTSPYNLTVNESISSVNVTAITVVSPTLFNKIEENCLAAPKDLNGSARAPEYFASIITVSNEIVDNSTVTISASYNLSVLPDICGSISWPDLTIKPEIFGGSACVDCGNGLPFLACQPDPSCRVRQPGSINITNVEPGHRYKMNVSIDNHYIRRQTFPITWPIDPFIPRSDDDVPDTKPELLAGILIAVCVIITVIGLISAKLLHRRKQERKVSENTQKYLELWGIREFTRAQIKMINPHQPVAKGEFSKVFKARISSDMPKWKHDNNDSMVAVKVLNDESMLRSEARLMARMKHDNAVRMVGYCRDPLFSSLILEWMDKGDLLSYLRGAQPDSLDIIRKVKIMVEVCNGLCYLNRCGVVHRDLAARNVLCNSKGEFKIADFGLGVEMQIEKDYYRMVTERKLPMKWMAPETLLPSPVFSAMSDIWSFGVLMHEIITMGADPYPDLSLSKVSDHVRDGGHPTIPKSCDATIYDLMKHCWALKPADRISPQKLLSYLKVLCSGRSEPRRDSGGEYMIVALVPLIQSH